MAFSIVLISLFAFTTSSAQAAFRAGDVGKSLVTPKGTVWIYGDSWNNGNLVRNAITLDGKYQGTIFHRMAPGHWMWLGAPFLLASGKVAVYGSEMIQKTAGMWGFERVGQVYVEFDPSNLRTVQVTKINKKSTPWSSAAAQDADGNLVYTIDAKHHPKVGRPNADGSVTSLATFNAQLSGQFSVVQDGSKQWWIIGTGMMLSRRVWAYPLASPQGPVIGKKSLLYTLPSPGAKHYVYQANIHPEEGGLLTYAVNGTGGGEAYGLRRIENFWTGPAKLIPDPNGSLGDLPTTDDSSSDTEASPLPGD